MKNYKFLQVNNLSVWVITILAVCLSRVEATVSTGTIAIHNLGPGTIPGIGGTFKYADGSTHSLPTTSNLGAGATFSYSVSWDSEPPVATSYLTFPERQFSAYYRLGVSISAPITNLPPQDFSYSGQTLDFYIASDGSQLVDDSSAFPPPSTDVSTSRSDCGMPVWSVSEPNLTLWVTDQPLGYQPSVGPRVGVKLAYNQREKISGADPGMFSVGKKWAFGWSSYIDLDYNTNKVVHFRGGGQRAFAGTNDYLTNTRLTGDTNAGYTLVYPDGSKDIFSLVLTNNNGTFREALLTKVQDAQSNTTSFYYSNQLGSPVRVRLTAVVDADNRTNQLVYGTSNPFSTNLVSKIIDPFGRTNFYYYDANGRLTNIVDVAGISSSFVYDANDCITNLITPYGTNVFSFTDSGATNANTLFRSVLITQPDGSHQLYVYTNNASGVASSYSSSQVPNVAPFSSTFDTNNLNLRNTFHWGARQYANLSTTTISSFTSNDFRLAHMKHWLRSGAFSLAETISLERQSSPDNMGGTEGQKIWYDYTGKPGTEYEGTQSLPLCVAQILPDGTTKFVRTMRNSYGAITTNVATYSVGSTVALRTNVFVYSTNDIDLVAVTNALGIRVITNTFNSVHEVLTSLNVSNELTSFTYDASNRLTSVTRPTGLVITNIYGADGYRASTIEIGFTTNSYTYSNALVRTHTDPRGLTVTNTWDPLERLTGQSFPDGTTLSNRYTILDLTATKDRLDHWSYFGYNSMRQNIAITNRLTKYTLYNHCSCGALDSVQDMLGNVTHYYYDNESRVTNIVYADNYSITNFYNLIGQVTNTVDSYGAYLTNVFNNQGLLIASSNAFGRVQATTFDVLDRATNAVDANGVTVATTYDNLNRILTRSYPDAGVESWGYTANFAGASRYTDQVGNVVAYGYDVMSRLTTQINVGVRTNQFVYSGAGDVTTLVDGNNHSTTWGYDLFGRNTNKVDATSATILTFQYDANHRLTNRTSAAKGTTTYSYDNEGNLLTVTYPTSPSIAFSYDAMNRMTNMTDGVGTSKFTYTAAGQLQSEDGPWSSDTINYTYNNRLRSNFTLQEPVGASLSQTYGHDSARRLSSIGSPAGTFTYSYNPIRTLQVQKLTLPNTAYVTNAYDSVSRLTDTWLKSSGGTILNYHGYTINQANQRTRQSRFNNDYVDYTYDAAGQLTAATGKESGGSPLRYNEQLGYSYDAAGNLQYRTNNTLVQNFAVNSLNEINSVNSSGAITVEGTTTSVASSVTVNGTPASLYADATFAATNMALSSSYTAIAQDSLGRKDTNTVTLNLSTNVTVQYDANGNLTNDNLRVFQYDDENQLTSVWATNAWKSDFAYDGLHRRRAETNYVWNSTLSQFVKSSERRFVYDGNLVVEERDDSNRSQVFYTRGRDLSGTLARAGGIGGLLARTPTTDYITSSSAAHAFYFNDGNGNVTTLTGTNQMVLAKYLYDSFGNTLSKSGPLADVNLYRFSSKEFDLNSGLIYFGLRFYGPNLQRWINRDPAEEMGGINLFLYVGNDARNRIDPLGLAWYDGIAALVGLGDSGTFAGAWNGFGEGWTKGGQGVINDFTGGLFRSQYGLFYSSFDNLDKDAFGRGIDCDSAFDFGSNGGRVAEGALLAAGGAWGWNAAGLPTMSIGWAPGTGAPLHFFWSVTTSEGTAIMHWAAATGVSTEVTGIAAGNLGGYLSGGTAITGIPILFPSAATAAGIASYNCLTGACGALRRGVFGF